MILLLSISGCAKTPTPIQISTAPVARPTLTVPKADELNLRNVTWYVITPNNVEEKFAELEKQGKPLVFFAVSSDGYENLSLNLNDLRSFIQQQQRIVVAYENYYNK